MLVQKLCVTALTFALLGAVLWMASGCDARPVKAAQVRSRPRAAVHPQQIATPRPVEPL